MYSVQVLYTVQYNIERSSNGLVGFFKYGGGGERSTLYLIHLAAPTSKLAAIAAMLLAAKLLQKMFMAKSIVHKPKHLGLIKSK